jgi:membrane-associated HD superfamily phosphohydrolase
MHYVTDKLNEVINQLIVLNTQIQDAVTSNSDNNLDNWMNKNDDKHVKLVSDYNSLIAERNELRSLLVGYDNVSENMKDTSLEVNQQMLHYNLHIIILAILLCLFVMIFGNISISMMTIPIIIALLLFILNYTFLSFIIGVIMVLYYIYSIPIQ